ncbi:hypothetical protein Ciccas_012836 [Cichlidogyrus casuarinus]|uniref:Uncharacterized protein n=1 Tax=Cichlidogyrus casuarinus TaxID=1844966 RepID=A0ABD2PNN7_9PLAT
MNSELQEIKSEVQQLRKANEELLRLVAKQEQAVAGHSARLLSVETLAQDIEGAIMCDLSNKAEVEALNDKRAKLANGIVLKSAEYKLRKDRRVAMILADCPESDKDFDQINAACSTLEFPKVIRTWRLGPVRKPGERPRPMKIVFVVEVPKSKLEACHYKLTVNGKPYALYKDRTHLVRRLIKSKQIESVTESAKEMSIKPRKK